MPSKKIWAPGLESYSSSGSRWTAGTAVLKSSAVAKLYSCAAPAIFLSSKRLLMIEEKLF